MKCKKCGYDNPNNSKFCSQCGSLLSLICPNCGKEISENDSFCNQCGQSLKNSGNVSNIYNSTRTKIPETTKKVLGIVLMISALVLFFVGIGEESWYQEDIIWYELGAILLSLIGIWMYQEDLFKNKKPLGVILMSYGAVIFLINLICAGKWGSKSFAFYRIDFEDIAITLFVFIALAVLGIVLIKKNSNDENDSKSKSENTSYNSKPSYESSAVNSFVNREECPEENENNTCSNETVNTESNETSTSISYINDKVHYRTVINGYGYWLAALISYVGLPIGLVVQVIQFFMVVSYSEALLIIYYLFAIVCQGVAAFGLKDFKRSAFVALMINYWTGLAVNAFLLIEAIALGADLSLVSSSLVVVCVSIPFLVYFYHRKESYSN